MSVVNDVLRNIDQRKQSSSRANDSELHYEDTTSQPFWRWISLILCLIVCMGAIAFILSETLNNNTLRKDVNINLPDDLFVVSDTTQIDSESDKTASNTTPLKEVQVYSDPPELKRPKESLSSNKVIDAVVINAISESKPKEAITNKSFIKENTQPYQKSQNIVKETRSSKASETVTAAINSGDMQSVKYQMIFASDQVQRDARVRVMMKQDPKSVLSYLKNTYSNFMSNPSALALAAQGEQRSSNHVSAINLYKSLIPLQPKDARWRAGLAISLEALGDKERAQHLYQLALSMNNLPNSLRRFSEIRLASINN